MKNSMSDIVHDRKKKSPTKDNAEDDNEDHQAHQSDCIEKKSLVRKIDQKNVERMLKSIPPGWKAPKIEIFRLLMTAFKNSNGNWDDTHFKDAEAVVDACYNNGFKPDLKIMNTMLGACVHESMWRRGLGIVKDMQVYHDLVPTAHTFDILLDCCRHAIDEPAVIFETLRLEGLPREYCYKASVINAGNRITPQVALESLYEVNKAPSITNGLTESYVYGKTYMPPIMRKTEYAPLPHAKTRSSIKKNKKSRSDSKRSLDQISQTVDSPYASLSLSSTSIKDVNESSFVSSTLDSVSTFKGFPSLSTSLFDTSDYHNNLEKPVVAAAALAKKKKQRKWTLYRDSMKNQLPRHSPGKLLSTKSVRSFEKQIEKVLATNLKCVNKKTHQDFGNTSIEYEIEQLQGCDDGNLLGVAQSPSTTGLKELSDPNATCISEMEGAEAEGVQMSSEIK